MNNFPVYQRKLDELGRIMIPAVIRKSQDWRDCEELDIFQNHDIVILRKHKKSCVKCSSENDLLNITNYICVCKQCWNSVR